MATKDIGDVIEKIEKRLNEVVPEIAGALGLEADHLKSGGHMVDKVDQGSTKGWEPEM